MSSYYDVFISYARSDHAPVAAVVDALRSQGVSLWLDRNELLAGELWQDQIIDALRHARAILAFLSKASVSSPWFTTEIEQALKAGAKVIPVLLPGAKLESLPSNLLQYQILDMNAYELESQVPETVAQILQLLSRIDAIGLGVGLDEKRLQDFAKVSAEGSGARPKHNFETESVDGSPNNSIFIVHGHDEDMLQIVRDYVSSLGVEPIVLRDESTEHTSLIQKFVDHGKKARFAVVLVSADDIGAGLYQYDDPEVRDRALQFRARQNVILELGFFYGLLHFEHVFVLEKKAIRNFPNFEWPSDLLGMPFNRLDEEGSWRELLTEKLRKRGYAIQEKSN